MSDAPRPEPPADDDTDWWVFVTAQDVIDRLNR